MMKTNAENEQRNQKLGNSPRTKKCSCGGSKCQSTYQSGQKSSEKPSDKQEQNKKARNVKGVRITWENKKMHFDNPVNILSWIKNIENFLVSIFF